MLLRCLRWHWLSRLMHYEHPSQRAATKRSGVVAQRAIIFLVSQHETILESSADQFRRLHATKRICGGATRFALLGDSKSGTAHATRPINQCRFYFSPGVAPRSRIHQQCSVHNIISVKDEYCATGAPAFDIHLESIFRHLARDPSTSCRSFGIVALGAMATSTFPSTSHACMASWMQAKVYRHCSMAVTLLPTVLIPIASCECLQAVCTGGHLDSLLSLTGNGAMLQAYLRPRLAKTAPHHKFEGQKMVTTSAT